MKVRQRQVKQNFTIGLVVSFFPYTIHVSKISIFVSTNFAVSQTDIQLNKKKILLLAKSHIFGKGPWYYVTSY